MHASLWILIGSNGILSLPHMSVRMQPPSSLGCSDFPWKLHCSTPSAFVQMSKLNISWENLCPSGRQDSYPSVFLLSTISQTLVCQSSEGLFNCHDSVSSRCLVVESDLLRHRHFGFVCHVETFSWFCITLVLFCHVCLSPWSEVDE